MSPTVPGITARGLPYLLVVAFITLTEVKVNIMFRTNIRVGSKLRGKKLLPLATKRKLAAPLLSGRLSLRNIAFMIKKAITVSIPTSVN